MSGAAVTRASNEDGGGKAEAIMDAAERRIREAGYGGFSFRDLAVEVGIKSASVHYHFPTKAALGAAVARRYSDRFLAAVNEEAARNGGSGRAAAFRTVFRRALNEDGRMCLCGVLGAEVGGLPPEVAAEARGFFERCVDDLSAAQGGRGKASRSLALAVVATLEGAMLLARTLGDPAAFDDATAAHTG